MTEGDEATERRDIITELDKIVYVRMLSITHAMQSAVVDLLKGALFISSILISSFTELAGLGMMSVIGMIFLGLSLIISMKLHEDLIESEGSTETYSLSICLRLCNIMSSVFSVVCLTMIILFIGGK